MKIRVINNLTNLGNIYLENKYIIITRSKKVKTVWLIKKKGTNCGIYILELEDTQLDISIT